MKYSSENANAQDSTSAVNISRSAESTAEAHAEGVYSAVLVGPLEHQRDPYVKTRDALLSAKAKSAKNAFMRWLNKGKVKFLEQRLSTFQLEQKWEEPAFENVVTTVGKNYLLDLLTASGFTAVGPFMGLIDTNASAAAVGDTMASHAGWLEVGTTNAPAYTAPRKTPSFGAAAAGAKATTATSFAFTSGGTVGGCFIVTGTGAVSTIDNTSGTLYSAGAFTGGSKIVANGDTLNVTYTASL